MQIVVRQTSGLGNQLFQYAAARYYARRHEATVRISVEPARSATSHGYPRPFLLSHFCLTSPFGEATPFNRFLFTERSGFSTASSMLKSALRIGVVTEPMPARYSFVEHLPIDPGLRVVYLVGYWQTYKTAAAIENELRGELRFKEPAQGRNLEVLQQIERTQEPVSLHLRRGDYTLAVETVARLTARPRAAHMPGGDYTPAAEKTIALPMEYYRRAISDFRERLADPTFFVFSDDMDFAKSQLSGDPRMVFIDHNDAYTSHEDLRLMSSCHHHIIANSSFSWWGAWLNPAAEKIVIAPRHWLRTDDSYYPDLLPPEWILLDTSEDTISPQRLPTL